MVAILGVLLGLEADPRTGCRRMDRAIEYAGNLALQVSMKAAVLGTVALLVALVIGAFV
jgi:hypothetical protein